ncbi:MAG TPA: DUF169 domain-containing protein [Candidatus Sulfotelmatobacter sp.]|nr:DUF169 domain-containing protein [Candidatus Sulfotelmatobacter sp.]
MDLTLRDRFLKLWRERFDKSDLPIAFYYTDREDVELAPPVSGGHRCIIGMLAQIRDGKPFRFDSDTAGCPGAKRYLGFTQELRPGFEHFLSSGIPGQLEGERYKKTPDLVRELIAKAPRFTAPARYIVFKRWDGLTAAEDPDVVIFYARPDVLSGLFTLANFDEAMANAVITPFAAGCGAIVLYPYLEGKGDRPRAVLGTFDVSARPFVPADVLSFAIPMSKFQRMVANMDESFLITPSWQKVRNRFS